MTKESWGEIESQTLTLVLHPDFKNQKDRGLSHRHDPFSRLEEAVGLANAIHLKIVHAEVVPIRDARPGSLFGSGVISRYKGYIVQNEIELVVIDSALTAIQQRNLEKSWGCKVIDRTGLILEIFGERARTAEGRLQVELAALSYQKSRLVRSWTHLERQRGGLGFVGGPGETQIEVDRRLISDRINRLKKDLASVQRTRDLHRKSRRQVPYPIVALVGYTNAGKSTLFNRLTSSEVFAKDILFATLDPTMRALKLPGGRTIILSDTVGFISDLPTQLVAAFRATLEEVVEADILLHVRDISHKDTIAQKLDVMDVLDELDLGEKSQDSMIEVLNKVDLLEEDERSHLEMGEKCLAISAVNGTGLEKLLQKIDEYLSRDEFVEEYKLALENGEAISWLYRHGEVLSRHDDDECAYIKVRLQPADLERFKKKYVADA